MRVLVTGGAGYIGSHAVRALSRAGHQPLVLDNLVYGHARIVREALQVPLVVGQVGDAALLQALLQGTHPELRCTPHEGRPIEAVLHFAAYAYVGESVSDPARYYRNNLGDTLTLLEALVAQARGSQVFSGTSIAPGSSEQPLGSSETSQPARARPVSTAQPPIPATAVQPPIPIVFSSTCATYGVPQQVPITEEHPQQPINPYGRSKWMVEQLLHDFARAYGLPSVIFRYFNAAGADPAGDLGEDHNPETHLIPLVLDVMGGQKPYLQIFGDDYPTPDGTCIRDYIHVSDLADAHVLGLERLLRLRERGETPGEPLIYNLGNGTGYSVQQVIETAKAVTGRGLLAHVAPRRAGDPAQLVAAAEKAHGELGWRPRYPELSTIIEHAWAWHQGALQACRDAGR